MNARSILFLAIAAIGSLGFAQDAADQSAEAPPSAEQLEKLLAEELASLEQKYEEARARLVDAWLDKVKAIAGQNVRSGNLREATEAWEKVVAVAPADEDAQAFFESIGRSPSESQSQTDAEEDESPTKDERRVWQRRGKGQHSFVLQPNGTWKEFSEAGRLQSVWVELGRDAYVIELKSPSGMVARVHRTAYYYTTDDGATWKSGAIGSWK